MDAAFALEVLDKAPYVTVSFTRPMEHLTVYPCRWNGRMIIRSISIALWKVRSWIALRLIR